MGLLNPRAFCPKCGAKIHTRKGNVINLRYRSQKTGTECPQCHAPLTGNVRMWRNQAELAKSADS